jgi:hypothetical protein
LIPNFLTIQEGGFQRTLYFRNCIKTNLKADYKCEISDFLGKSPIIGDLKVEKTLKIASLIIDVSGNPLLISDFRG